MKSTTNRGTGKNKNRKRRKTVRKKNKEEQEKKKVSDGSDRVKAVVRASRARHSRWGYA